jgi:chromosome segregation ATPase
MSDEHETSMLPPPPEEPTSRDHKVPSEPRELDPRTIEAPPLLIELLGEIRAERDETRAMQRELADGMSEFFSENGAFGALARETRLNRENGTLLLRQFRTFRTRLNGIDDRLAEGDDRFEQHDDLFEEHDGRLSALEADKAACEKRHAAIEAEIAALKAARGNAPEPPGAEPNGEADAPA